MSVKFLSQEWCDAIGAKLNAYEPFTDAIEGKSGKFQRITTETPDGECRYWMVIDNGKVSFGLGELDEPAATVTESYETAVAISKNELDGNDAFMRGKTRADGNMGTIMQFVPAFQQMQSALADLDVEY